MRIAIVLGTRPEIIKMSPIIKECIAQGIDYYVMHTGQHYSYSLDGIFFQELGIPSPKYNLDIGSRPHHGAQTGVMIYKIENRLLEDMPDVVLVEGDTNTVLAGAIAASKLHIGVAHVEAGLRSYNRRMPEEINRVLTDHCSDLLFAPTGGAKHNLKDEGIQESQIFVTGNTIVDALYSYLHSLKGEVSYEKPYALLTLHRTENIDDKVRFESILDSIKKVNEIIPVVYPIHPHTLRRAKEFKLNLESLKVVEPMGYLEFLKIEKNANIILTDSGGVQEEACILGVPCITLRDETERPETVFIGANVVAGTQSTNILECVNSMMDKDTNWGNPFGDGHAGKKIINILRKQYEL